MTTKPSVLVVTTQIWLQITRLTLKLASHGCRVSVLCPQESHLTYASGPAQRFRYSFGHPADSLRKAIAGCKADYILPMDDRSVWAIHDLAEQTPSLRPLIERSLGDPRFYPLLRSRFKVLSLARSLGIAVPRTELIQNASELQSWGTSDAAGFVLKKDGTWGGCGVQIVHSAIEAQDAHARLAGPTTFRERFVQYLRNGDNAAFAALNCLREPEITAQVLVPGVPATAMFVCDKGRILGEVQARVVASIGKTGPSIILRLMRDPRITRAGTLLAESLQLSGCFGLDFMLDARTEEPLLIELNPRATQLGHLSVPNQPDLAGLLWAHWSGQPTPPPGSSELSPSICFYPQQVHLSQEAASLAEYRIDLLPSEEAIIATLVRGNPAFKSRLRKSVVETVTRVRGSLRGEGPTPIFFHQDLSNPEANARTAKRARSFVRSIRLAS